MSWTRVALAALLILGAPSAAAQMTCADRASIVEKLERVYGETRQGYGVVNPTTVMELWAVEGGSWTILKSYTNGTSCIVVTGEHWQIETPKEGEPL